MQTVHTPVSYPSITDAMIRAAAALMAETLADATAANPSRTDQEKDEQRADAREKRRNRRGPTRVNRFREARAIACGQMGLRYRPVPAPQNQQQFSAVMATKANAQSPEQKWRSDQTPRSFEILTERVTTPA